MPEEEVKEGCKDCTCGGNCGKITTADLEKGIENGTKRHRIFKKLFIAFAVTLPVTSFMWQGIYCSLFVVGLMILYFLNANANALSAQVGMLRNALSQVIAASTAQKDAAANEKDATDGQYL